MKIIAISDLHGNLIDIKNSADILVIAGDFSPLYCQQDYSRVMDWINRRLIPWISKIKVNDVILVPGNHDLVCTYKQFSREFESIVIRHNTSQKIHYLNNSSIIIEGKKFFGTPNSESPRGWAFSDPYNQDYLFDSDTDILVTHQPPKFGNVGFVKQYQKELGSYILRSRILQSDILINICGHIHTGQHGGVEILLNNGRNAYVYNVSVLDENYDVAYPPTLIEIN